MLKKNENSFEGAINYAQMHAAFSHMTEMVTAFKKQLLAAGWSEEKAEELAITMIKSGLEQNGE